MICEMFRLVQFPLKRVHLRTCFLKLSSELMKTAFVLLAVTFPRLMPTTDFNLQMMNINKYDSVIYHRRVTKVGLRITLW
mgnify:CR=1 FL=1